MAECRPSCRLASQPCLPLSPVFWSPQEMGCDARTALRHLPWWGGWCLKKDGCLGSGCVAPMVEETLLFLLHTSSQRRFSCQLFSLVGFHLVEKKHLSFGAYFAFFMFLLFPSLGQQQILPPAVTQNSSSQPQTLWTQVFPLYGT